MKLCIVTHRVVKGDGQGRVNYEVAWEAIRRGYHVTLLASSVDLALQQHSQVDWISIPVKGYPLQLVREIAFSTQTAWWLNKHQKEFDLIKLFLVQLLRLGEMLMQCILSIVPGCDRQSIVQNSIRACVAFTTGSTPL